MASRPRRRACEQPVVEVGQLPGQPELLAAVGGRLEEAVGLDDRGQLALQDVPVLLVKRRPGDVVAMGRLVAELDRLAVGQVIEHLTVVVERAGVVRHRPAEGVGGDQSDRPEVDPERRVEGRRKPPRDLDGLGRRDVAIAQGDQVGVAGDRPHQGRLETDRVADVEGLGNRGGCRQGRHVGRPRLRPPDRGISRRQAWGIGLCWRLRAALRLCPRHRRPGWRKRHRRGLVESRKGQRDKGKHRDTHPASGGDRGPRSPPINVQSGPRSSTAAVEGSFPQADCFVSQ